MNAGLTEAVEGIETVKGAAQEDDEIERFERNARRVRDAFVDQGRVEARFLPLLLLGIGDRRWPLARRSISTARAPSPSATWSPTWA